MRADLDRTPKSWILSHPEMEAFDSSGDGKFDNCPPVEKIWGEIEKCLYYHYVPEQIMWVPGSESWLFVEIEGCRQM